MHDEIIPEEFLVVQKRRMRVNQIGKGMLVGMIIQVVETDTKGMSAEYAISYNGTSFTSGTDTGSITYQDNTPLTVSLIPAGTIFPPAVFLKVTVKGVLS